MATSTCTLNGIKYNNAAGKYGNWANYSYKTSGVMYAGWAGSEGADCAMVFKITIPSFSGISNSFSITMGLQNQVDNGGPTTLNWSLATTDSYVTGNKYADGVNYPLTNNGELDRGTVSLNFRYASYTSYTLTFNTSKITSGGTYYLILYRYDKTGISAQYPTNITLNYKNTYQITGTVKIWNGSTWVNGTPYIYNGSSWVKAVPYVYNGSTWKIGLG